MTLKVLTVILALTVCCYCADNEVLVEDARAKKKKNSARLWAMILFFVFSKVAIFKVVSVMLFMAIFQKLFALAGIFLKYFMNQRPETPPHVYGPPADYNTIPYSYGPPEIDNKLPGHVQNHDFGLPALNDIPGSFNNWLFNKNH